MIVPRRSTQNSQNSPNIKNSFCVFRGFCVVRRQRVVVALIVVTLIVVACAAGVHAQAPQPRTSRGAQAHAEHHAPPPPTGARVPRPQAPPTSAVAPFPNIATISGPLPQGLNPPFGPAPRDLFRAGPRSGTTQPYLFPGYAYGYGDTAPVPPSALPAPEPPVATGLVRFDVTPRSAQVFVDGLYAGTVEDIDNRRGLVLSEGPHRIEFRARGYAVESVDVQVPPRDVITYRGALDPERPAPAASRGPATMYVIPGCYMGNVPPRAERVGPGCDVKNVRVIAPPDQSASATHRR